MSEDPRQNNENPEVPLDEYKKVIPELTKGRVTLLRDLYFMATTQRGYELEFDVKYEEGCSPTESLLLSIAGCLSIDIVHILRKMRCDVDKYEVEVEGTRKLTPPQYYTSVDIMVRISGKGITAKKIDRAIALSQNTYCSVYHTLRDDMKVNVKYEIE